MLKGLPGCHGCQGDTHFWQDWHPVARLAPAAQIRLLTLRPRVSSVDENRARFGQSFPPPASTRFRELPAKSFAPCDDFGEDSQKPFAKPSGWPRLWPATLLPKPFVHIDLLPVKSRWPSNDAYRALLSFGGFAAL